MPFPVPPATLSPPDYPEVKLDFNLSLSRAEVQVLEARGEDGPAIRALAAEYDQMRTTLLAEETTEEERQAIQARVHHINDEMAAARHTERLAYAAVLAKAYCNKAYEAYGLTLDFRTAESTLATLDNPELPDVFVTWLQYAPTIAIVEASNSAIKTFRSSLPARTTARS